MSNFVIMAIRDAHYIAAEIDIQALHGGLPAYVSKSYDRNFTSGDYISLVVDKLEAMGYEYEVECDNFRKNITILKAYTKSHKESKA